MLFKLLVRVYLHHTSHVHLHQIHIEQHHLKTPRAHTLRADGAAARPIESPDAISPRTDDRDVAA